MSRRRSASSGRTVTRRRSPTSSCAVGVRAPSARPRGEGPTHDRAPAAPRARRLGRDAGALPRRHGVDRRRDRDADGDREPRGPRHLLVGVLGVHPRRDHLDAALGPVRGPLRTPERVSDGAHDLPRRVGPLGLLDIDGGADRVPDAPGAGRRRAHPARHDDHCGPLRPRAARAHAGLLLGDVGTRVDRRAAHRRLPDRPAVLALGVLRQHPVRAARRRHPLGRPCRDRPPAARGEGRLPRRRAADRRPWGSPRRSRGGGPGGTVRTRPRRAGRPLGGAARRVRPLGASRSGASPAAPAVHQPHVPGGGRHRVPGGHGDVRHHLLHPPLRPGRARRQRDPGRLGADPVRPRMGDLLRDLGPAPAPRRLPLAGRRRDDAASRSRSC